MHAPYPSVLIMGPPGSGKGTQGKMLDHVPGFIHSSSGDVFRKLSRTSEAGRTFLEYSSRGDLVPDDVTIDVWKHNIEARQTLTEFDPEHDLLVLDGIPRNLHQAELMDEHVDIALILHLHADDEDAFVARLRKRALKEKRVDDAKEEVIRHRLEVYHDETRPVLDHYDPSLVREIDPMGTPAAVFLRVLTAVVPVQERLYAARAAGAASA